MHQLVAGMGLKALQALAESKGLDISVGSFEKDDLAPPALTEGSAGPEPLDVAARIVAHVGHRVPGVQRIEKRLEGRDKSSGILSDLAALGAQLYARNEHVIERVIQERFGKKTTVTHMHPNGNGGVVADVVDFGAVGPSDGINHDGGGI